MTTSIATEVKRSLPTISEIYDDKALIGQQNDLNIILNSDPAKSWVKNHPYIEWLKYIPIERIEYLLTCIFVRWEVVVKDVKLIANSVVVTITLRCQDPINPDRWITQDWVGAMPIQVSKGKWATEFDYMSSGAIQMWAPSAESFAIKDAAEKLGKIFGKDLNRKDDIAYVDRIFTQQEMILKTMAIESLERASTIEEIETVWIQLRQIERNDEYVQDLYNTRKKALWK